MSMKSHHTQGCGNSEPNTRHFDSTLVLLPYTLYTVQFQFTGHSLDLSDNVLHDWLTTGHTDSLVLLSV